MCAPLIESFSTGSSSTARRLLARRPPSAPERHRLLRARTMPGRNLVEPELFLLLRARSSKSQLRLLLVLCHARDDTFDERTREMNRIVPNESSSDASKASLAAATSRWTARKPATNRRSAAWQQDLSPGSHRSIRAMVWYQLSNPLRRMRALLSI